MRALVLLLVAVTGCATSTPRADTAAPSPKLRTFLGGLCEAMQADACRPELAKVASEDLATVVIADLGEQEPEFEQFLARSMAGVAPAQRKQVIEQHVGDALGAPWSCRAFDELWGNQRPSCE